MRLVKFLIGAVAGVGVVGCFGNGRIGPNATRTYYWQRGRREAAEAFVREIPTGFIAAPIGLVVRGGCPEAALCSHWDRSLW